jgi:protein-S-isoprenylcysteine O-methyltransferase Ste14
MKRERIIGAFFVGLLLLVGLEVGLIEVFNQITRAPILKMSWLNSALGLLGMLVGASLVIWSVRIQYILGEGTPSPRAATRRLITTGPYAFTRNPMTLGAACFYLGIAIWSGSVIVIALVLVIFASLLTFIYFHETPELSARFGLDYLEYMRMTPFLFPKIRRLK